MTLDGSRRDMTEFDPSINAFARIAAAAERNNARILVIGGHAINAYGYNRTTVDFDFVIPGPTLSIWRDELQAMGYRWRSETRVFAQFSAPEGDNPSFPIDLMFVDEGTFEKLWTEARVLDFAGVSLRAPKPTHLIALKLHALKNPARAARGKDLPDIVQLMRIAELDLADPELEAILRRYADERTIELLRKLTEPIE